VGGGREKAGGPGRIGFERRSAGMLRQGVDHSGLTKGTLEEEEHVIQATEWGGR